MKFTTTNGYITLKIALRSTDITRTIVVPECITLTELNDAIQCVMGWENAHLWMFQDGREGPTYELPHEDDFEAFYKRLSIDSNDVTLGKAFPKKGAKLTYIYDFGDDWTHIVTRMADPKTAEIACTKVTGPDGIEDFGGQWRLGVFIADMQKNPNDEKWSEVIDWAGFDDKERLAKYLKGESAEAKTAKLKDALSYVTVEVPTEADKPKKMSDEEQARTLGLLFATSVSEYIWDILEDAFRHDGKCEFIDCEKTIAEYLMTMFEGLKIKDGVQTPFCTNPSTLTVHKKWVEWYAKYGKDWLLQREPYDILEDYALSVVHLYGVMNTAEFYEYILRYDPGLQLSHYEVIRILNARAIWRATGFHIDGDLIVDDDRFAPEGDDQDKFIRETMEMQKKFPRWYPSDREELFKWAEKNNYERTAEVDRLKLVLRPLCKHRGDELEEIVSTIYNLMRSAVPPDGIYKSLVMAGVIDKLSVNRRQPLLVALENWIDVIRQQCLNGNTPQVIRAMEASKAAEPKISRNAPCPCGSGKKYKMCCGKDK